MVEGSALRIGLLAFPFVISSNCGPSNEEIAATVLVALSVAYLIALVVLALLVWLWRRTREAVDVEWAWQLGVAAALVVVAFGLMLRFEIESDYFAMAVLMEAPLVATLLCGSARLALARESKRLMRCAPILAAGALAIPNLLVFVVGQAAATRITDADVFVLFFADGWPWRIALLALLVEAILVGREPSD